MMLLRDCSLSLLLSISGDDHTKKKMIVMSITAITEIVVQNALGFLLTIILSYPSNAYLDFSSFQRKQVM